MAGYGTDADFESWLEDNGYEVGASLDEAVLRQRGAAYIDGLYGARFTGSPTGGFVQERAWPRTGGITAAGEDIPSDVIPAAVIQASYFAALQEATAPGSLSVSASGAAQIKREKVGSIEVEYAVGSGDVLADATPRLATVEGLLAPFLGQCGPAVFVV